MDRLYHNNRGLVGLWVKRYAPLCVSRPACAPEDLEQAGFLGLVEAAKTWDPARGAWFTWASYYVRGGMLDALGLRRKALRTVSLDTPLSDDDLTLGDTVEDDSLPPIGEAVEQLETVRAVREAVAAIADAEVRTAIERVYLQGMERSAAADAMGITAGHLGTLIRKGRRLLFNDDRLREAVLDEETKFHAHKSAAAFMRDHTSVVEAAVIWREGRRERIN